MLTIADPYFTNEAVTSNICAQVRAGIDGLALWAAGARAKNAVEVASPATSTR
jgi:hypothetical protein